MELNAPEIGINKVEQAIELHWKLETKRSLMLWGPSGIGKTTIVRKTAEKLGAKYICLLLNGKRPSDVFGLQYINKEVTPARTGITMPDWFPMDPDAVAIIHLDEFTDAPDAVRNTMYGLLNERELNGYPLPKNVLVIASGNMEEDGALHSNMSEACANRLTHYIVRTSLDMMEPVVDNWHPLVKTYLERMPNYLIDLSHTKAVHPTPRAWEAISDVMNLYPQGNYDEAVKDFILGRVGTNVGNHFINIITTINSMPNCSELLGRNKVDEIISFIKPDYTGFAVVQVLLDSCVTVSHLVTMANVIQKLSDMKNNLIYNEMSMWGTIRLGWAAQKRGKLHDLDTKSSLRDMLKRLNDLKKELQGEK